MHAPVTSRGEGHHGGCNGCGYSSGQAPAAVGRVDTDLKLRLICWASALLFSAVLAHGAQRDSEPSITGTPSESIAGLADSAGLRATVFGTPLQELAPLPASVPLMEVDIAMPWARPVPKLFWFDRSLRVWFSAQPRPAPLAIVIAGLGDDGNTAKLSILRGALYGAGYHVLTMPSPTFPGFIVSTSSTGVAGDLLQDSHDLYAAMQQIIAHLPRRVRITDIDVLGYSLGAADAAVVKSIDASEHKLHLHRAVMINPPVSLLASITRIDRLFAVNVGAGQAGVERLYRQLYAGLANLYRASDRVEIDEGFMLGAAAAVLKTDAEFAAAVALSFRLQAVNMFFAGDLYAGTGVVVDPNHWPKVGDSLEHTARVLRGMPSSEYFTRVLVPYYLRREPHSTIESLSAECRLDIVGDSLRDDADYYAQTNSDDLILDRQELDWLRKTLGSRIVVYDHGGHLGNLGERGQIADMLNMLAGHWNGP
jgi:hypothetical protein